MKTLPSALIIEKNRLSSPYPWVPLVYFDFSSEDLWLAGDISNVTYPPGGQVYTAYDFEVQLPDSSVESVVPECKIIVANQSRVFEEIIIQSSGGVDSYVTITIVNTNNLNADYTNLTWDFVVLQTVCNSQSVVLTCSLYSPLDKRFPPDRYYGGTCRYKYFKGAECKYSDSETTCDRSLSTCRILENQTNFGGFPGIYDRGVAFLFSRNS